MKKILDYITNNVEIESGQNQPTIPTPKSLSSNVIDYLLNNLPNIDLEYRFNLSIHGIIPTENSSNILIYGMYHNTSDVSLGFVYIVDENMNPLKLITTFESGSLLFPIFSMNQDEDGNLYASSMQYLQGNYIHRLLLFNNALIPSTNGEYNLILRKSYILSYNGGGFNSGTNAIKKIPGTSTYYIVGFKTNTEIIEYKVNVGSSNEMKIHTLDGYYNRTYYSTFTENDGEHENYYFYSYEVHYTGGQYVSNGFAEYKISNGSSTKLKTIQAPFTNGYEEVSICAYDLNNIYAINYDKTNEIEKIYKLNGNSFEVIWEYPISNITYSEVLMPIIENKIGFIWTYKKDENNKARIGIFDNENVYISNEYATYVSSGMSVYSIAFVSNYNLTKLYIPLTSGTNEFILDYNPINYNGVDYSNYNSLIPQKMRLYSNNELVFARNLSNKTLYQYTKTSTMEIPNTLLNDININKEDLIGETNSVIVSKSDVFTKNIYEKLYVNFIQSISVVDEDTNTLYQDTASYINSNLDVGTKTNCESSFVGKVRIIYPSSTIIQDIFWVWNTNHYETSFVIDATQKIPTLEFISNDESTTYITKTLDIASGSYYLIKQKLRIE